MKILQNNIQSINTSLPLLRLAVQKLNIDIILLQEIWHPTHDIINIKNYTPPIVKLRKCNNLEVSLLLLEKMLKLFL